MKFDKDITKIKRVTFFETQCTLQFYIWTFLHYALSIQQF